MLSYTILSACIGFLLWLAVSTIYRLHTHTRKYFRFDFSRRNYYIMMSPFVLAIVLICVLAGTWQPLINFVVLAAAGVIGETLFSLWWDIFFPKRFWVYSFDALFRGYTSLLNFIPWGVGGLLFLAIIEYSDLQFNQPLIRGYATSPFYIPFAIIFILTLALVLFVAYKSRRRHKLGFEFSAVTVKNYIWFCLPIILPILLLAVFYGVEHLVLALLFGLIAFVAEYLFGKACVLLISKRLWYYSYFTIDNNHTKPLNIIPFMAAGFYFWTVALLLFP
jgi:hypothetical protein